MDERRVRQRVNRIVLDVGGQEFKTSGMTLEPFDFFRRMLGDNNWREGDEEVIFLDRDPDCFRVLLSILRCGPGHAASVMPKDDVSLCVRVLKDAEFFGATALLREIKQTAQAHLHPLEPDRQTEAAFDAEHEGPMLDHAIHAGVLPACIFGPPPPPPPPPPRYPRIRQLIPASDTAEVRFKTKDQMHPDGHVLQHNEVSVRKIACYALVEREDGRVTTEPVIARRPDEFVDGIGWGEGSVLRLRPENEDVDEDDEDRLEPNPIYNFRPEHQLMLAEEWAKAWENGPENEHIATPLYWAVKPNNVPYHRPHAEHGDL